MSFKGFDVALVCGLVRRYVLIFFPSALGVVLELPNANVVAFNNMTHEEVVDLARKACVAEIFSIFVSFNEVLILCLMLLSFSVGAESQCWYVRVLG